MKRVRVRDGESEGRNILSLDKETILELGWEDAFPIAIEFFGDTMVLYQKKNLRLAKKSGHDIIFRNNVLKDAKVVKVKAVDDLLYIKKVK